MKVHIEKLAVKNFLSVGNTWLKVDFETGLHRVNGINLDNNTRNGCGKSSIFCDALMYGLFGKPLRKINVSSLVNLINKKKCEVKLQFKVEDKCYLIHRGIKPSFLRLYENYSDGDENLKNNDNETEECSKKYTQNKIDALINSNFTALSQMLVMSNTYTSPFLDLDAKRKREIIENILGVVVFGDMADKARTVALDSKSELKILEKEYDLSSVAISEQEESIEKLKTQSEQFNQRKKAKITKLKDKLKLTISKIEEYQDFEDNQDTSKKSLQLLKKHLRKTKDKLEAISVDINSEKYKIKDTNAKIAKIEENSTCPICHTNMDDDSHVHEYLMELKETLDVFKNNASQLLKDKKETESTKSSIEDKISDLEDEINEQAASIRFKAKLVDEKAELKSELIQAMEEKNNFLELIDEDKLKEKQDKLVEIETNINKTGETKNYYEYVRKLLSDDGVKNYIIRKILKFWNMKVNHYLSELNAEFDILFDEKLNATIRSRKRDALDYHGFSGGEKARIDVAILLSVIDISKLQNSIDLNVIIIDELLDGGLDDNGRSDVINLFEKMAKKQNKSIYVISHNANLPVEHFNKEITLVKQRGFTNISV